MDKFVVTLLARKRELSLEIAKVPRKADGSISLSATAHLRKERDAIDKAIAKFHEGKCSK